MPVMKENSASQTSRVIQHPFGTGRWLLAVVVSFILGQMSCQGALPEPYNLIYGTIEMDGRIVSAADTTVTVEARRLPTGATIARYVMGSQSSAGNYYALKIRLETPAPDDIMHAAETGTTLYLTVLKGTMVKNQLEYDMGERGVVKRLDFGNVDTDHDGLPDGWEQAYLFGLQFGANDDPDGDGVSNIDEYHLGTHPFRPDARHPADVDQDWRISIPELSAYYSAWKRGNAWPIAPTNIPLEYVTRATYLWEQGEAYHLNLDGAGAVVGFAPTNWVPGVMPTKVGPGSVKSLARSSPSGPRYGVLFDDPLSSLPLGVVTMSRPNYWPGETITLTNRATVRGSLRTYAVQQHPPLGWTVVSVEGGVLDTTNNLMKWGPYFDRASRDLVFTRRPPADVHGLHSMVGAASYDGFRVATQGITILSDLESLPSQIVFRPSTTPRCWILQAPPLQAYALETSSDLTSWLPILTNWTDAQGRLELPAATETKPFIKFYRARLVP